MKRHYFVNYEAGHPTDTAHHIGHLVVTVGGLFKPNIHWLGKEICRIAAERCSRMPSDIIIKQFNQI